MNDLLDEENLWFTFISPQPATKTASETESSSHEENDEDFDDEGLKFANKILETNPSLHVSEFGKTQKNPLDQARFYLLHYPNWFNPDNKSEKFPLVIFFHGIRSSAWSGCLQQTSLIQLSNQKKFFVAFGQASGEFAKKAKREANGWITYGSLYWGLMDPEPDVRYLRHLIEDAKEATNNQIDEKRIYYIGSSRGGLFSCSVATMCSDIIAAVININGGIQEEQEIQVRSSQKVKRPLFIYSGTEDMHLPLCQRAKELFEKAGFPVGLEVIPNHPHKYPKFKEEEMWKWLSSQTLD
mmetsp:Transcript_24933/g.34909  ORF Transcript_24933/g.34909 Transcript_24933/m.34909 type:complete len:297 (+) Transcript_24933:188-1078(+)